MKSTETKVQLNIRINEKLLNEIKYGAKIRGLRVNEYCESLLKNTSFDESSYRENFESRISRLENYIDNHMDMNASQNLSKKYCKDFGNLLSNYFISIARNKLLSREELWEELLTKKSLKHVPEDKITLFQDILRGEHIYSPSELTDSITYGDATSMKTGKMNECYQFKLITFIRFYIYCRNRVISDRKLQLGTRRYMWTWFYKSYSQ